MISLLRARGPRERCSSTSTAWTKSTACGRSPTHPSEALSRLPDFIWAFLVLDDADLLLRIADSHAQLEGHLGLRAVASTAASEAAEVQGRGS